MPKFNCCTPLGIVIWNEHSRHYTWYVRRWYIQITSSRWRLERCTFQRNKHALFSIADSQRQADIKRQGGSKTCKATMSHPVDKYGEPWDSTACGSACYLKLKARKSCQWRAEQDIEHREREDTRHTVGFHLLSVRWSCVWTWRAEEIALLLQR